MQENIKNKKPHIVYLGETGFPFGLGAVQRMILVAKSLISVNVNVTVVLRKGTIQNTDMPEIDTKGIFEGINYIYTSPTTYRPKGFVVRNWAKLIGIWGEYIYLKRLKANKNITGAVISCMSTFHVLRYRIYSSIIGFPIVLNFVELGSEMRGREKLLTRLNDYLFDNYIVKIVDGALPISDKLKDYFESFSPTKPCLKLPIICDFDKFNLNDNNDSKTTFLYCGAASYFELIDFILSVFDELKNTNDDVVLQLILGGKGGELEKVNKRIDKTANRKKIKLITNVDHKDIPRYYSRSTALLIPIRPTVQDEARFPHKIGEYLASGKPMITTRFGEIRNYDFIDQDTALIAEKYEIKSYSEKMQFVIDNPIKSKKIGLNGREMGLKNFDYKIHGQPLKEYFSIFDRDKK